MEEGEKIYQDLCGKLKSVGGVIDGLFGLVAHDEQRLNHSRDTIRPGCIRLPACDVHH